jgi:proteasome lid subunit RPN8/RPN11
VETFVLAPALCAEIIAHARSGYPEEVCGLIAGSHGEGRELYRAQNLAATPRTAYVMDVATLARQIEFADRGQELAAIYHSHPAGPDTPSPSDIAQAFYPHAVYLICSLRRPEQPVLRAFRIRDGQMWEVGLLHELDNGPKIN